MDRFSALVPWHAHATTRLFVHLVWSTRHRAPWLEPQHDAGPATLLERKARSIQCALFAVGNAADHVHVLVHIHRVCAFLRSRTGSRAPPAGCFIDPALPQRTHMSGRLATGPSRLARVISSRSHITYASNA